MPGRNGMGPPWWHGRFRGQGYRLTESRQAIFDVLSKSSEHLSAEDVYMAVHKTYPAIGLTTVYRTLELLVNMGIAVRYNFGDGRARYELVEGSGGKKVHQHLVCTNCGAVIDCTDLAGNEAALLEQTEKEFSRKYDFTITHRVVQFSGLCSNCRKRK